MAQMGERKHKYRVLAGKPECKTPHGIPKSRWESNIKMDLKGDRVGRRGWTHCG